MTKETMPAAAGHPEQGSVDAAVLIENANADPEKLALTLDQQIDNMRKLMQLHQLYKKHIVHATDSGTDDDPSSENSFICYDATLCDGCGMPVTDDGFDPDDNLITESSMDNLLGSGKKYDLAAAYIVCMQDRLKNWQKKPSSRAETDHLSVDEMMLAYKDHFDHTLVREQLLRIIDGVMLKRRTVAGQTYGAGEVRRRYALFDLVRYEEHFLGKVTPATLKLLLKIATGSAPSRSLFKALLRSNRESAATLYLACAIKYKMPLDRSALSVLMKHSKDLRLKHEMTARTGKFRLSAVKGTQLDDSMASYDYIRKYKPELLQDYKWVSSKLRLDKYSNRMVAFRYFIDYGLNWADMDQRDEFVYALAKFIPNKHAGCAKDMKDWMAGQRKSEPSKYAFVFGNDADRIDNYRVDSEYHLMHMCSDIEMFYTHMLSGSLRARTNDPANDLLRLPNKHDYQ